MLAILDNETTFTGSDTTRISYTDSNSSQKALNEEFERLINKVKTVTGLAVSVISSTMTIVIIKKESLKKHRRQRKEKDNVLQKWQIL